jgi:hypothetical protein
MTFYPPKDPFNCTKYIELILFFFVNSNQVQVAIDICLIGEHFLNSNYPGSSLLGKLIPFPHFIGFGCNL